MRKQILTIAGLAFLAMPILAVAAPNFSGDWLRDNAKSDPAPNTAYWLTRSDPAGGGAAGGRGGRGGGGGPKIVITVKQDANTLSYSQGAGAVHTYKLDGKPFTQPMDTGIQKATVTASFKGDTLVVDSQEPYGGMPGNATLNVKEEWALSPDGKTLTVTTTRDVPAVIKTFKQVYTKQ